MNYCGLRNSQNSFDITRHLSQSLSMKSVRVKLQNSRSQILNINVIDVTPHPFGTNWMLHETCSLGRTLKTEFEGRCRRTSSTSSTHINYLHVFLVKCLPYQKEFGQNYTCKDYSHFYHGTFGERKDLQSVIKNGILVTSPLCIILYLTRINTLSKGK